MGPMPCLPAFFSCLFLIFPNRLDQTKQQLYTYNVLPETLGRLHGRGHACTPPLDSYLYVAAAC